jgi:hypothetical protein
VSKAKSHQNTLIVVQDSNKALFGVVMTEHIKISESEKYYGNGTIAVWSFARGKLEVCVLCVLS